MLRRGDWNHYRYTYAEGREAEVAFDVQAAFLPASDRWPHGLRVLLEAEDTEERVLQALDALDALLVGRLRYAGRLELVLQVVDPALVAAVPGASVEHTPGWDYFQDRVSPSPVDWRRIEDRETVERLGLAADQRVRAIHRFFGDPPALRDVRERLLPEGFEFERDEGRHLAMAHVQPVEHISIITVGLLRLCEQSGVAYEGWNP
ncbi:MAG: hypothetical protein H6735_30415 [Alphaproteobacteria bacterium]|nr:hypothetical protein [Alphaproteobacteria bacterium]